MSAARPVEAARPTTFAALFLTTLSLLQLELFLTRIFSVAMWYHFAFMAISIAMFGLAFGAVAVELAPEPDPHRQLAKASLACAVSIALGFALQCEIEVDPAAPAAGLLVVFGLALVPFAFAGVVVATALTRFPRQTARLYAVDLAGSALGCLLAIPILNRVHAPSAVLLDAALPAFAAALFARSSVDARWLRRAGVAAGLALVVLGAANVSRRFVDLRWIKGKDARRQVSDFERWNALSRIRVRSVVAQPFAWGMSPRAEAGPPIPQLKLSIDADASTMLTPFRGDVREVEFLTHDVTAIAHHLRKGRNVLVIGAGGGRDLLTAVALGQRHVTGVEINPDIVELLRTRYADFTGHLAERPDVTLAVDEARSFVTRSHERFGIIQASLIDTFAASAAGAYVLSENGIYTREAWVSFLEHLDDDGILTMSRWHYVPQPSESLRLAGLAGSALRAIGVERPREHVMMVRVPTGSKTGGYDVATILVSRAPFSAADVAAVERLCEREGFVAMLTPSRAEDADFARILDPAQADRFVREHPLRIDAPTDDAPFFFNMARPRELFSPPRLVGSQTREINLQAVRVLRTLLAFVVALAALIVGLPMLARRGQGARSAPLTIYFGAIGIGFMLVEVGALQRLIVFLGHPIYGLSVVVFVLLVASSVGSALAGRLSRLLPALPIVVVAFVLASPSITRAAMAWPTPARFAVAAATLVPMGLLMGLAVPRGMALAARREAAPTAWYWGVNGATSVVGSVLAIVVSMTGGITTTLVVGVAAYALAIAMAWIEARRAAA